MAIGTDRRDRSVSRLKVREERCGRLDHHTGPVDEPIRLPLLPGLYELTDVGYEKRCNVR